MNQLRTDSSGWSEHINRIILLLLLAWAAIIFTTPVGEGDFFWHVKTGEWIWQHKAIPDSDPFSFTVKKINPFNPESKRIPVILKQYWLGQLAFFGTWKAAGVAGMVLLRSFCYTAILFFSYRLAGGCKRWIVPLLTVVAVANVLRNYSNERPQIFGFILMPILLFLLERLRSSRDFRQSVGSFAALLLVMLLWSNCHGSFILGIAVIALYAAGHLVECAMGRDRPGKALLLELSGAVLITVINPNGYGILKEFFVLSKNYTNMIAEFSSPVKLALQYQTIDYFYWLLVFASLATILYSLKKMAPAHILVIAALLGLSLTATRYIPFFVMAVPLLCRYIPEWHPGKAARFLPLAILLALLATTDYGNVLKFRAERSFPENASKFLNRVKPHGNMFNYVGWGGYLMCYNTYPVFVDGRTLVEEIFSRHNMVLSGIQWQSILQLYDINFIIIPGTDAISLKPYPLLLQLLGDKEWALIYQDEVALVLIRETAENREIIKAHALDKNRMASHIQERWQWQMKNDF